MRKLSLLFLVFVLLCTFYVKSFSQSHNLKKAFTLPDKELIPEGMCYSPSLKSFFVGSIAKRKIVKVSSDKKVVDFIASQQDSIGEVLGLKTDEKREWVVVANNHPEVRKSSIHVFDFSGKLIKSFPHKWSEDKILFNDLVIAPSGDIFITDSDGGAIYRVDKDLQSLVLFLKSDQLRYANGITLTPDGKWLIVSTARGFVKVNPSNREIKTLPFLGYNIIGIDGLYTFENSLVGIQNVTYPACVIQYFLSDNQDAIISAKVLTIDDKLFNIPTTGAIVGNKFFLIANSQLDAYENGALNRRASLSKTTIVTTLLARD